MNDFDTERYEGPGPSYPGSNARPREERPSTPEPAPAVKARVGLEKSSPKYRSELEAAYARHLAYSRLLGKIDSWFYEPLSINLPGGQKYTIDFMVIGQDGSVELHEVKGMIKNERDTRTRYCAARAFLPMFEFRWVTRTDDNAFRVGTDWTRGSADA